MKKQPKYSPEVIERAVRMVREAASPPLRAVSAFIDKYRHAYEVSDFTHSFDMAVLRLRRLRQRRLRPARRSLASEKLAVTRYGSAD